MKLKLSLFTLILSVFFISCKKNSNDTPTIDDLALLKQKVLGNWITTGAIIEYYDASGKLANTVDQSGTSEQTW